MYPTPMYSITTSYYHGPNLKKKIQIMANVKIRNFKKTFFQKPEVVPGLETVRLVTCLP